MNKVAAEIIAGVIPCRMMRNRWRGILRYGPWNALKLKFKMWRDKSVPQYYLAVCAIAKNEAESFKEWIEWHRSIGVEKFYIYDNESTDNTKEVLRPYIEEGIVEYHYFPGFKKQLEAYDDCFSRHRLDTRWIAFIDLDEFIIPVKDKTLPKFLKRFEKYSAVEINWLTYGSGGQKKKTPGGVMKRFKCHSSPEHMLNRHVKSIVNPRKVCNMVGAHEAARISGKTVDSHGDVVKDNFRHRDPIQDVIRINHYAVKSLEEFVEKQSRGRACGRRNGISLDYFHQFDLNDICEDTDYSN